MAEPVEKSDQTVYHGNCHCGRYRFQVTAPEIKDAISCNCILCRKKGYLWLVPEDGSFKALRDDGSLQEYKSAALADKFCNYCGTGVLGEHLAGPLKGKFAINVRTILDVNPFKLESVLSQLEVEEPDRKLEPLPEPATSAPQAQEVLSCHCGSIRAELLVPLKEGQEVKEDNCSQCVRNAYIGVYPRRDQVRIHNRDETFEYRWGRKFGGTTYCKICGVHVWGNIYGPPLTMFDKLPRERREHVLANYYLNMAMQPLNVRAIDGVDLPSIHWLARSDDGTEGYTLDP